MKIKHRVLGEVEMSIEEFVAYEKSLTGDHEPKVSSFIGDKNNDGKKRKKNKKTVVNRFLRSEVVFLLDNLDKDLKFLVESVQLRSRHTAGSIRVLSSKIKHGHMDWIGRKNRKIIEAYYKEKGNQPPVPQSTYTEDIVKKNGDYDKDSAEGPGDQKPSGGSGTGKRIPQVHTIWADSLKQGL